ncbi:peptidoglycan editing factor PgeF [Lentibacillus saliphilus]|uniref:peptidoglycan editing factor PgeF n=1 Tax=Lentibacillus saliphilus TaxID=2737028 RepID=UPI001FE6EED8|nr:peptidoglycan editing factor PgeF [Lentibacillus saliphilus]
MNTFIKQRSHFLELNQWQQIAPSLRAGFTTRYGGYGEAPYDTFNLGFHVGDDRSTVIKNRSLLADKIMMPLDNWVVGEQVHGNEIAYVNASDKGKGAFSLETAKTGVDGLMTDTRGILCAAFFADCVPLFFFDPKTSRVGIAHAGWKGTVNEIAGKMVERFSRTGSNVNDLRVTIGPAISQDVYEVDDRVIQHIPSDFIIKTVKQTKDGHGMLDLKQLNMEILLKYGVLRHNVDIIQHCTFQEDHLFFSHRRTGGQTGRMLGYIGFLANDNTGGIDG